MLQKPIRDIIDKKGKSMLKGASEVVRTNVISIVTRMVFSVVLLANAVLLIGCYQKEVEIKQTKEIERILLKNVASIYEEKKVDSSSSVLVTKVGDKEGATLPSKIEEPHLLLVCNDSFRHDGDQEFYAFRVPLADVSKWTEILVSNKGPVAYVAPNSTKLWWVSKENFSRLTFYDPRKLSGRSNGWVGVDTTTGEIFVYTFAM